MSTAIISIPHRARPGRRAQAIVPPVAYSATRGSLSRAAGDAATFAGDHPLSSELETALNLTVHPVEPCQTFTVGPYRVSSVPATHDPRLPSLLYAIERDGRAPFDGTDTGPLPDSTWDYLARRAYGLRLNR